MSMGLMMIPTFNEVTPLANGFYRVAVLTLFILLIPLIAMQFTDDVNWGIGDFIIMGVILLSLGNLFILVSRKFPHKKTLLAVVFVIIFLAIWVELAVGIFT